ncbi:Zn-dependent protease with chaperone function [Lachnospiraceae bacterium KH1T2]|nr:Zn-dependent protease with chaperone function [Lachnospiraceae bacterium KH1T2]
MKDKKLKRYKALLGDRKVYEMDAEEAHEKISKEIGEMCRHCAEKRWYHRLIFLNVLMVAGVIAGVIYEIVKEKADDWGNGELPDPIGISVYGIIVFVIGILGIYYLNAKYRANAVRITENNFPEVYEIIEEYSNKLGIAVPKAYIMQGNGSLNAFSTFLFKRQWISINAEVFEVAYREHKDMDSLKFVIAHELSHIYYGHATLRYNLPIWFADKVPVIGSTASRAREYSCDRLAQRLTGVDGIDTMLMLTIDRHLYKFVDKEDYLREMKQQKGFFVWFANLIADHPLICKRVWALKKGRGSGALY